MNALANNVWPPELVERVRALTTGEVAPAVPRDAATVVLIRDAAEPRADGRRLEVYLLRRVPTMAFAAGMYVFPGGRVDDNDHVDGELPAQWADDLTGADQQLLRRIVGAAIRETLEEAGVRLRHDDLRPFAHWVTPEVEPRRYDTRFLLARLPGGEVAALSDGEADHGHWVAPDAAGDLPMLPPTAAMLFALSQHADTAEAWSAPRAIRRILPRLVPDGEGLRFEYDGVLP